VNVEHVLLDGKLVGNEQSAGKGHKAADPNVILASPVGRVEGAVRDVDTFQQR